jgi:hypothetical protein
MTVNPYFNNQTGVTTEQNLVESLIIEEIQLSGRDYAYIPRNTNNIDQILNEAPNASFGTFKTVEMWVSNYQDFAGNNLLMTQFGISSNNTAEFVVSRSRFATAVQAKPLVGDLIYDSLSKLLFQIDYCDSEPSPSYDLQKLYTYTLKCSLFTYSYENMATTIPAVDNDLNPSTFTTPFDKSEAIEEQAEIDDDNSEGNPFGNLFPNDESGE